MASKSAGKGKTAAAKAAAKAKEEFSGSVTRCICEDNEDQEGFMICCEQCEVWQHGDCMGVTQKNVPDEYYCDQCKPNHPIHEARRKLLGLPIKRGRKAGPGRKPGRKRGPGKPRKKREKAQAPAAQEDDDSKKDDEGGDPVRLTREQRKMQNLMLAFKKMEDRQIKKPRGRPPSSSAETVSSRSQRAKNRSTKPINERSVRSRKRKRAISTRVVPTEAEMKQKKEDIALGRRMRKPPTPMYLGKKHWLLKEYREEARLTHDDYAARLLDDDIGPVRKRLQYNYLVSSKMEGHESDDEDNNSSSSSSRKRSRSSSSTSGSSSSSSSSSCSSSSSSSSSNGSSSSSNSNGSSSSSSSNMQIDPPIKVKKEQTTDKTKKKKKK